MHRLRLILAIGVPALIAVAVAPSQQKLALSIDTIMRGPGLAGYEPASPRWSGDGKRIFFEWKQASDPVLKANDTYVVNRDGSGLRKLTEEEAKSAPPSFGDRSKDRKQIVYVRQGDLYIYDLATDKVRQVTKTSDVEANPRFTQDGKRIWFTRANNLYMLSLDNGFIEQLSDIRVAGAAPATPVPAIGLGGGGRGQGGRGQATAAATDEPQRGTDSQEFIKKEERELLEIVRLRAQRREEEEARRKKDNPRKPLTLQGRQTAGALTLSPDEKTVIATIVEPGQGSKNTIVPNYVTESAYTEDISGRSKVGDSQGRIRVALISVTNGEVKWVDHGQKLARDPETKTETKTETTTEPPRRAPQPQDRDVQLAQPVWSEDGTRAVMMARSADNKDRWILSLDAATGKTRVLVAQHDDAWINGPGSNTLGWMKDDRDVYFQSERDGFSHLYVVSAEGGEPRQLTSGKWEVTNTRLSEDKTRFYLTTSESDLAQQQLYSMAAEGGERTRITTTPGHHRAVFSPDETWIADLYSYTNKPTELYSMENRPGASGTRLTTSPAAEFGTYPWIDVPIVKIKARDGVEVPAHLYKPANFRRGGPAVIFVHGAGYLQNVTRAWSNYYREYMFHHFLMEHGYLVIDIDYRGSAGYGRDWRAAIYRHMGGKDLDDHVDAAKWLVSEHGVDPKTNRAVWRQLRRFHHADGAVHAARCVRGGRGAAAGHGLGALQQRLHVEHLEHAAEGRRVVPKVVTDLFCVGAEGGAADLSRDGGCECALSGHGAAGAEADRAAEGELGGRDVPGGGSRVRAADELGGRV